MFSIFCIPSQTRLIFHFKYVSQARPATQATLPNELETAMRAINLVQSPHGSFAALFTGASKQPLM
jgi:hypothetical protein